jgi:hypothetical protein
MAEESTNDQVLTPVPTSDGRFILTVSRCELDELAKGLKLLKVRRESSRKYYNKKKTEKQATGEDQSIKKEYTKNINLVII